MLLIFNVILHIHAKHFIINGLYQNWSLKNKVPIPNYLQICMNNIDDKSHYKSDSTVKEVTWHSTTVQLCYGRAIYALYVFFSIIIFKHVFTNIFKGIKDCPYWLWVLVHGAGLHNAICCLWKLQFVKM